MYMHDYGVCNERERARLRAVYATVTSMEPGQDGHPMTGNNIILKRAKYSYCRKVSFTFGLLGSTLSYERNAF